MSLLSTASARQWRQPGSYICQRCSQTLFQQSGPLRQRQAPAQQQQSPQQQQQRRHQMSGKAFATYGPKYTAKIDKANEQWRERGERIKAGEEKSMWDVLEERGYVKDVAGTREGIRSLLIEKRIGAYVGIDPTASSLHLGHLVPLMPLFWMYINGYRAITMLGGATAKIGDPTDRLTTRERLQGGVVAMNMVKMHYQLKKLWMNVDVQARRYGYEKDWAWRRGVLQNGVWWNKLTMLDVLQRLGSGMRVGPMLGRDTVKRKMEEGDGVSFAEFAYPLMQTWDWWHMYYQLGVQMQIGGSDQFGNIITGVEGFKVIRSTEPDPNRKLPSGPMHDPVGFTVPLLTDSKGAKFGKSAGNAVWLDKFKTPTVELYGYFMRRPDEELPKLLRMFTFLPMERINELLAQHEADPTQRPAHHVLAYEVVLLVHGKEDAIEAQKYHRMQYGKPKAAPGTETDVKTETETETETTETETAATPAAGGEEKEGAVDVSDLEIQYETPAQVTPNNAPRVDMQLPRHLFDQGRVARILYAAGMVNSVSEGNRLAVQRGAYVGAAPGQFGAKNKGMLLTQLQFTPVHLWYPEDTKNFIIEDRYMVLRKGKHNVRVIEIVSDEEWMASGKVYPGQPYTGRARKLREQIENLKRAAKEGKDSGARDALAEAALQQVEMAEQGAGGPGKLTFPDNKSKQIQRLEKELREEMARTEEQEAIAKEMRKAAKKERKETKRADDRGDEPAARKWEVPNGEAMNDQEKEDWLAKVQEKLLARKKKW